MWLLDLMLVFILCLMCFYSSRLMIDILLVAVLRSSISRGSSMVVLALVRFRLLFHRLDDFFFEYSIGYKYYIN